LPGADLDQAIERDVLGDVVGDGRRQFPFRKGSCLPVDLHNEGAACQRW